MRNLSDEEQVEVGRRIGERVSGVLEDFPAATSVGRVERVAAHDGGCVSLVHPASIYRKRQLSLPNTPEGKTRLESHASTVQSDLGRK